jgi:hypothetical protein
MTSIGDVPRSELRRIDEAAESDDDLAERLAAAVYGWRHANDEADWYDARDEATGTKAEVKSTHLRVGDEYPADGRFRLWRSQLRSLVASRFAGETGTSWVVFVLFDGDQPVDIRRMHARTARDLVEDTVGWGPSGHTEFGEQAKVPVGEVFPDR